MIYISSASIKKIGQLFLMVIGISCFLYAQDLPEIVIMDKVTGKSIPYASILVRNLNSTKKSQHISDTEGKTLLELELPCQIEISCLGYENTIDTITSVLIDTIYLEPSVIALEDIVVNGHFQPRLNDKSIYRVEVINKNIIEQRASNNLSDLFKTQGDFYMSNQGVLGQSVNINGFSGEHVKILMDGVPVAGRLNGIIDLSQLNLASVQHIEIIKGPLSVLYGSNAMGGAINIITKSDTREKFSLFTRAYYENVGIYNIDFSTRFRLKKHQLNMNLSRHFHSGLRIVDTSRYKIWKPKLQYNGSVGYRYSNKNLRINGAADYIFEELRDEDSLSMDNLFESAIDKYYFTHRLNTRLNLKYKHNSTFSSFYNTGLSYYKHAKISYNNNLVELRKTVLSEPSAHDTTKIISVSQQYFLNYDPTENTFYQFGMDFNFEELNGNRVNGEKSITDLAAILDFQLNPLRNLQIQPGLRVIYNTMFSAPLIYSLHTSYKIQPATLRLSYSKGFRTPSIKELYLEFVDNIHRIYGNEKLKPETSDYVQWNTQFTFAKGNHIIKPSFNIFYTEISNKIDFLFASDSTAEASYYNLAGKSKSTGGNLLLSYNFIPRFTFNSGIHMLAKSKLKDKNTYSYSTDYTASFHYDLIKYNIDFSVFYKYNDKYFIYRSINNLENEIMEAEESYVDAFHTMDITFGYHIPKPDLKFSFGIKNVFDNISIYTSGSADYHGSGSNSQTIGWGRSYFFSFLYNFKKY